MAGRTPACRAVPFFHRRAKGRSPFRSAIDRRRLVCPIWSIRHDESLSLRRHRRRWPLAMVISGLALLVIGILSFFQHITSFSASQGKLRFCPTSAGRGHSQGYLAPTSRKRHSPTLRLSWRPLFRTDENSSDPTTIDVDPAAERIAMESEPPVAVNEAHRPISGLVRNRQCRWRGRLPRLCPSRRSPPALTRSRQQPMPKPVTGRRRFRHRLDFCSQPRRGGQARQARQEAGLLPARVGQLRRFRVHLKQCRGAPCERPGQEAGRRLPRPPFRVSVSACRHLPRRRRPETRRQRRRLLLHARRPGAARSRRARG